jgi:hypothetical protein
MSEVLKRYIVSCEPAKRSKAVLGFNFLISAEDYKAAWVNCRAALNYGHMITVVSFEGENYRDYKVIEEREAAPGQYTAYKVYTLEKRAEKKRKAEPTIKELLATAETEKVTVSKPLLELIGKLLKSDKPTEAEKNSKE